MERRSKSFDETVSQRVVRTGEFADFVFFGQPIDQNCCIAHGLVTYWLPKCHAKETGTGKPVANKNRVPSDYIRKKPLDPVKVEKPACQ